MVVINKCGVLYGCVVPSVQGTFYLQCNMEEKLQFNHWYTYKHSLYYKYVRSSAGICILFSYSEKTKENIFIIVTKENRRIFVLHLTLLILSFYGLLVAKKE